MSDLCCPSAALEMQLFIGFHLTSKLTTLAIWTFWMSVGFFKQLERLEGWGMEGVGSGFRYPPEQPGPAMNWTSSPMGPSPQHKTTTRWRRCLRAVLRMFNCWITLLQSCTFFSHRHDGNIAMFWDTFIIMAYLWPCEMHTNCTVVQELGGYWGQ